MGFRFSCLLNLSPCQHGETEIPHMLQKLKNPLYAAKNEDIRHIIIIDILNCSNVIRIAFIAIGKEFSISYSTLGVTMLMTRIKMWLLIALPLM